MAQNQIQILNHAQCFDFVRKVGPKRTVFIEGENGIGKTAMGRALGAAYAATHFCAEPVDCTQMSDGSIWMPDIDRELGVSRELPNERFGVNRKNQRGVNGSKPVIVVLDEVMKVPQFIKNMLAPIMYEHRIGDYKMPDGSIVVAYTNLSAEGLGDSIQPHLRSRLIRVQMRKPTQQEWKNDFAIPKKLNATVIAWTEEHPRLFDSFLDWEPGGQYAGKNASQEKDKYGAMVFNPRTAQDCFVSPRTLHALSDVVDAHEKDPFDAQTLQAAVDGTIGIIGGAEFAPYLRFASELVKFERVISDPKKAPITSNPTAQLVQIFQFMTRTDSREQAAAVVQYVMRMKEEIQTLFVTKVANSNKIVTFANAPGFSEMLSKNKIYLGGK